MRWQWALALFFLTGCSFDVATQATRALSAAPVVPSFQDTIAPVLRQHCGQCHVPGGQAPEHAHWFDATGRPAYFTVHDHAALIVQRIEAGEMPKAPAPPVSKEELALIKAWVAAGAPNN